MHDGVCVHGYGARLVFRFQYTYKLKYHVLLWSILRDAIGSLSEHDKVSLEAFSLVLKFCGIAQEPCTARGGKLKNIHSLTLGLAAVKGVPKREEDDEIAVGAKMLKCFAGYDFPNRVVILAQDEKGAFSMPRDEPNDERIKSRETGLLVVIT